MFASNRVLGCTRRLVNANHGTATATLFRTQPLLKPTTTLYRPSPHLTRLQPLVLGGIRHHGSHGHHHDADLINSLKSSSK